MGAEVRKLRRKDELKARTPAQTCRLARQLSYFKTFEGRCEVLLARAERIERQSAELLREAEQVNTNLKRFLKKC